RMKTYSAQSGYVYQYFYEGQRPAADGTEFVFNISADRKNWNMIQVLVAQSAVETWQAAHERELNRTEWYAIAKLALFQAFDEPPDPSLMTQAVHVRNADIEAIVETLGL